ncbi:hypothetical protein CAPTEDRAFT_198254 [Capitella teleta]|uniref:Uncharacterized protein n=1 Tax=Capitella teleta TaxID=283909 RepID=R7UJK3_CAPTE|nr:hypothetical protein CAPTEDRAFT_198254 [Capitella teleta]|eukprot:ELU06744.1 hypothetical protein CAPTEDRAFT_198254 [Capitella teleta]
MSDVAGLLEPLLSLVDGRNDKPYPNKQGECVSRDVLDKYRRLYRYKESPETMAIINAKHQAMEVLDLFFNFSFNEQLEQFVKNFKTTYSKAHHVVGGNPELGALLYESYDIYKNSSTNNVAMKLLRELIQSNDFFQAYPLKDVLMDLSHYEYEKMVVKSMTLLDRKFSARDNLFKRAVQAQVDTNVFFKENFKLKIFLMLLYVLSL